MSDDLNFDRADDTSSPTILPPEAPVPEYLRSNASDSSHFVKAIVFGIGAAIAGCLVYAGFTIVTHIEIGYVALGVGYLVGWAMMNGSGKRGGRAYQIAACILTYFAVSMAVIPEALWGQHADLSQISAAGLLVYGIASPFLGLGEGFGGIIGLFILFVGMRAAWRLTSADRNTAHHPFSAS